MFTAVVESMAEPTKTTLDRRLGIVLDGIALTMEKEA